MYNSQARPSTPTKKTVTLSKKAFGAPTKLVLEKVNSQLLEVNIGKALKDNLGEILQGPDYLNRIKNLHEKLDQLSETVQKLIAVEKESMIKKIMENQPKDRSLAQQSVNEFFDFISEQGGVFENVAMELQKAHPNNRASILSKILVDKENPLFKDLGEVSSSPDYFFEFNETAKALSECFMKNLYEDQSRKAVISGFQEQKKQSLRLVSLNKILTKELLDECKLLNKYVLYRENEQTKAYITAPLSELDDLTFIKLDVDNLADLVDSLSQKKNRQYANQIQQEIDRNFEELPLDANIEGCISFFPIKTVEQNGEEKYTCLVTTSGEVSKLNGEKSKVELAKLQEMLKSFASSLPQHGHYTFVYYEKEQPGMDFVLDQMNKGLSGTNELSENQEGFDPHRGCAEKKFIAFLRNLMLQKTKFEVLGSANRRIRLDDGSEKLTKKIQDEKTVISPVSSEVDLYKKILIELELESATTDQGQEKIKSLLQEGFNPEEFNPVLDKVGLAYNKSKPPAKKQIPALIKVLNAKIASYSANSDVKAPKNKPDASVGAKAVTSDFIPCCTSCQVIKMPTLTLFEAYRAVITQKQAISIKLDLPSRELSGCQTPPSVTFRVKPSSDATSLTPEMDSLGVVATSRSRVHTSEPRRLDFN
jgi:hypothetical protein